MISEISLESGKAPAAQAPVRPFYWSVRRELWENRSLSLAPIVVAVLVLLGTAISVIGVPRRMQLLPADDLTRQNAVLIRPFNMAPAPIMLATFLIGFFYSLEALFNERRDRSILFWKSLPISDRVTVLSKMAIPVLFLPAMAYLLSVVVQLLLLLFGTLVLAGQGISPLRLWREIHFLEGLVIMLYGLVVHALWFAPINAWFLFLSGWSRRNAALWALLPPVLIGTVETILSGSTHFFSLLRDRFIGAMSTAFVTQQGTQGDFHRVTQLTPLKFLSTPGLWLGLAFAAACLAGAVRIRRYREPI